MALGASFCPGQTKIAN